MGAKLDRDWVRSIADLARLQPSEEDEETVLAHLRKILDYVSKLDELDTSETPPSVSVLKPTPLWRADARAESLGADESVRPAPDREGGYFRVPRVID